MSTGRSAKEIRGIVLKQGAVLCGFASQERFAGAPEGFRPRDVDPDCRTVLVFAIPVLPAPALIGIHAYAGACAGTSGILPSAPAQALKAGSCVPYTFVNMRGAEEADRISIRVAWALHERGIRAVPIPSDDPYEHWEPERQYGRAILSLRHAGWLAGLGRLGKNTLLINDRYGNMIQLGALLLAQEVAEDPLAEYEVCPAGCSRCLEVCPVNALDGRSVDQARCRPLSNARTEKGYTLKRCNQCRVVCPRAFGSGGRKGR